MTPLLMLTLAIGAYGFRWAGLTLLSGRELPPIARELLRLCPVALIGALILTGTFATGELLVVDERVVGVGLAAVVAWRRLPPIVVFLTGVGVVALLRTL